MRRELMTAAAIVILGSSDPQPIATPDMTPPIAVEVCSSNFQSDTNPNLKVGIAFRNDSLVEAVDVKFAITLVDTSNRVLDTQIVTIDGRFAPGVLISPRRGAINDTLLTQPEYPNSPAWNVANHFGSNVASVRCIFDSARFADGSMWPKGN
jgi:hypothetical protein